MDGIRYPVTAAGIQAAIDGCANSLPGPVYRTGLGPGGTVVLPDIRDCGIIDLGTTTLQMRSRVHLTSTNSAGSWLTYSGSGAAINFPIATAYAGLSNISIAGTGGSPTQIGINISGNFPVGLYTIGLNLSNLRVVFDAVNSGQIGLNFVGVAGPADIQACLFHNIYVQEASNPIVSTNTEGNIWTALQVNNYGAGNFGFVHTNSMDNQIQARIIGPATVAGAFNSVGSLRNVVQLVMDIGAMGGVQDSGGMNVYVLSPVAPTTAWIGPVPSSNTILKTS